jgi:eukaryotic-like serine/threonine-protein kinase
MGNLTAAYAKAGKLDLAIPLQEKTLKLKKTKLGPDHFSTLASMNNLGWAYEKAGKLDLAVPIYEETLKLRKANLGPDHPETFRTMAWLGRSLLKSQAFTRAEPLLHECLSINEKARPDDWQTFDARSLLGGALLGQKKFADAEPYLRQGYEGMKQREQAIPLPYATALPEAVDRLIELGTATNRPDEVKKWQAERAKYPQAAFPPQKKL